MGTPFADNYPEMIRLCLDAFDQGGPVAPLDMLEAMMSLPNVEMHTPEHHFMVPAALLTAAHSVSGRDRAALERNLHAALTRSKRVPGGSCGDCGCCGAAVGAGIFAALWLKTTPKSTVRWADANRFTAWCLESIATVDGPRCCKRVSYLAIEAAVPLARELLGVDLGELPKPACTRFAKNAECLHTACPYFPSKKA